MSSTPKTYEETVIAFAMAKPEIKITPELITHLWQAQLRCVQEHTDFALKYTQISDDSYDYLHGSLVLATMLTEIWYEKDHTRLHQMLNSMPHEGELASIACDGICAAIYELNPRALDTE